MKTLIYNALTNEANLDTVPFNHVNDRVYTRYSLGQNTIPDKPDFPWILIGELPGFPARNKPKSSDAMNHFIQFYVFDEKGSFVRIEAIMKVIYDTILGLEGELSPSGSRCLGVRWDTTSQDYDDDHYDAFVKHITFRVTGSTIQA